MLLIGCLIVWIVQFFADGLVASRMPAFGPTNTPSGIAAMVAVMPTVVYNYGFVATVPSWLNEKKPSVSVVNTMLSSVVFSTLIYIVLGVTGGMGVLFPSGSTETLLALLDNGGDQYWLISRIATFLFPICCLMTSIPVFAVIIRYNLVNTGIFPLWLANIIAVVVPWVISLIFYPANTLNALMNWSSALLFVALNMVIPLGVYIAQARKTGIDLPMGKVVNMGLEQPLLHAESDPLVPSAPLQEGTAMTDESTLYPTASITPQMAPYNVTRPASSSHSESEGLLHSTHSGHDHHGHARGKRRSQRFTSVPVLDTTCDLDAPEDGSIQDIQAWPRWVRARINAYQLAIGLWSMSAVVAVGVIASQVYSQVTS